jgi:hypothetical protein
MQTVRPYAQCIRALTADQEFPEWGEDRRKMRRDATSCLRRVPMCDEARRAPAGGTPMSPTRFRRLRQHDTITPPLQFRDAEHSSAHFQYITFPESWIRTNRSTLFKDTLLTYTYEIFNRKLTDVINDSKSRSILSCRDSLCSHHISIKSRVP